MGPALDHDRHVALALARARIMGARYPYYLLADSPEGLRKEAEVSGRAPVDKPTYGNVRQGFVYERVPHITLKSIANNTEIDVIYDEHQPKIQPALDELNAAYGAAGAALYQAQGAQPGQSEGQPSQGPEAQPAAGQEDVVEADYEIVDDKK